MLVGIIHLKESIKSEALEEWYPCIFGPPNEETTFLKIDHTYGLKLKMGHHNCFRNLTIFTLNSF
jgi:hypothetical protein